MFLESLMNDEGDENYYDDGFLNIIDDHRTLLLNNSETQVVTFKSYMSYKYEGDLIGILEELNISRKYAYAIMRLNGMVCVGDLKDGMDSLIVPPLDEIDSLLIQYKTKNT